MISKQPMRDTEGQENHRQGWDVLGIEGARRPEEEGLDSNLGC